MAARHHDFIVVGSGPSGAMAAQTLAEAGADTAMLDVGFSDQYYREKIPDKDFLSVRRSDEEQHIYFLGKNFDGIPLGRMKTGTHITPPRAFVTAGVKTWLPFESDTFNPIESLAYGGLGSAWGLNCFVFSSQEIKEAGLNESVLQSAYRTVAKRIGISATQDDASPYCAGDITNTQPPARLENNLAGIYSAYQKNKVTLNTKGFYAGRTALALLTKNLDDRKGTKYRDMDFWINSGNSAYRPSITIDALKRKNNFTYYDKCLVTKFSEKENEIVITAIRTDTGERAEFACRTLILAAGTLGTARIIMRSFDYSNDTLPILSNQFCYFPSIHARMLGKSMDDRKISYSGLALFYDKNHDQSDVATILFYTYRSLLMFRLAKELPFNFADGFRLLSWMHPALVIPGVHHPERYSPEKYIRIIKDEKSPTGDRLTAHYRLSNRELADNFEREKKIKRALRQLGCYPLRKTDLGNGSSIHYGGTLPFNNDEKPFTINSSGRLNKTKRVFIADGSGFRFLPSKGPTLTLMANAHSVAQHALKHA